MAKTEIQSGIKITFMRRLLNLLGNIIHLYYNIRYRPPSPKGAMSKFLRSTVEDVVKR